MPTLYTSIGPWSFPTFNLILTLAVLVSVGIGLRRVARSSRPEVNMEGQGVRVGAVADAYLGALAGAVVGARVFHVLLNWDYFAENLNEAFMFSLGGLDWHGAVLGGLAGLYGVVWIHAVLRTRHNLSSQPLSFRNLLDSLTPAVPLISLAAWWGCLAASCGYGMEVDNLSHYPPIAVSETADVYGIVAPRYNTQLFGLVISLLVLLLVVLLSRQGWLHDRRFWLTLALLSAGMFVIGFYRGDHVMRVAELRGDQVLDVLFVLVSVIVVRRQPIAKE